MKLSVDTIVNTALGVLLALIVFKLADTLFLDMAAQKIKEKTSK